MEEQRKRIIDHNEHMLHVFIVSYRQFVSPTDFFSILVNRFKTVKEKESRLAVLKMLGVWLDKYMARDFFFHDKGNRLFDQLLKFIDSMVEMGYQEEGNKLKLLILRIKAGLHDSGRPRLLAASMITPILRNRTAEDKGSKALERSTSSGDLETLGDSAAGDDAYKKFSLCEMPLVELAEQLTLIELQMFRAIREREFLNLNWKKPENKRNSRHVVKMVERFNKVSYWVATRIVRETDLKRRTSLVKRFIILAEKCAELNNFNTLMEVLAGLNLHPVQRLKQTWSNLSPKYQESMKNLEALMENKHNYKNYRDRLNYIKEIGQPTLPYLGVYLRDLTFIEEGNNTISEDGLVNYEKIQLIGEVIREVQYFQAHSVYTDLVPATTPTTVKYLKKLRGLKTDQLDEKSKECEPPRNPQ
ncbi:Ras guanine nucleotide exchange factor, variant 2 [Balamuthia mandrillaris]